MTLMTLITWANNAKVEASEEECLSENSDDMQFYAGLEVTSLFLRAFKLRLCYFRAIKVILGLLRLF
jgi:hypothetical protein